MSTTDPPTSSLVPSHHVIHSNETSQSSSTSTRDQAAGHDTPQNHQYECIPEYLLTMTRHPHSTLACHQLYHPANTSSICAAGSPYTTFTRSYIIARGATATVNTSDSSPCTCSPTAPAPPLTPASVPVNQEESSTPLLSSSSSPPTDSPKNAMIAWTRRTSSSNRKSTIKQGNEHRHGFLSPFLRSSKLK